MNYNISTRITITLTPWTEKCPIEISLVKKIELDSSKDREIVTTNNFNKYKEDIDWVRISQPLLYYIYPKK